DVRARLQRGSALPHEDRAARYELAREALHAEALAVRVAPVARGPLTFLVSHGAATSDGDGRNADLDEVLAVPVRPLIPLPLLLLVDEELRPAHLAHDDGLHGGPVHERRAEAESVGVSDGEDLGERDLVPL